MQVQVHSIHFDADQKLIDFLNEKVGKLQQFHEHILNGEVFLRLEPADDRQNKLVEIKISVPGKDLFAKKNSTTFEEAAEGAVEALRRQIRKYRTKKGIA